MAGKKYEIKQIRMFNGEITTAKFNHFCDATELASIVSSLEGVVEVYEQNSTLGTPAGTSMVVTAGDVYTNIILSSPKAAAVYVGAYGKGLLFKKSTDIQVLFKTHKPFEYAIAEIPTRITAKMGSFADL